MYDVLFTIDVLTKPADQDGVNHSGFDKIKYDNHRLHRRLQMPVIGLGFRVHGAIGFDMPIITELGYDLETGLVRALLANCYYDGSFEEAKEKGFLDGWEVEDEQKPD